MFAREIEAKLDAINSEEGGDLDHDFDSLEVQEAVDALNYHKAAAEDGTKNPMYKCGGEFMVELLVKLFNFLKMKEMTPENWSRSVVVNLYKDGDRTDPSNYRGIALISCLRKLYLSLCARRITNHMEPSFWRTRVLPPQEIHCRPDPHPPRGPSAQAQARCSYLPVLRRLQEGVRHSLA